MSESQEQVAALNAEIDHLRARLSDAPKRMRALEERLLETKGQLAQAVQAREALRGKWIDARTLEVMHRGWHIDGQAVRPDHRMVAHTGFLTVARLLAG